MPSDTFAPIFPISFDEKYSRLLKNIREENGSMYTPLTVSRSIEIGLKHGGKLSLLNLEWANARKNIWAFYFNGPLVPLPFKCWDRFRTLLPGKKVNKITYCVLYRGPRI